MINNYEQEKASCLFFDTYAFYEIIKENVNYKKYLNKEIITSKLNLFELYFIFLKENSADLASSSLEIYYPFVKDFDREVIASAAKLKKMLNIRDVSMTDCIGYCFAKQLGIKFLTGDLVFKEMENVEFVQ
ncbi:MAG: PIN domain-containing protein [Nanoarchaeota archaeon]